LWDMLRGHAYIVILGKPFKNLPQIGVGRHLTLPARLLNHLGAHKSQGGMQQLLIAKENLTTG